MTESKRSLPTSPLLAAMLPLAALFGGLFLVWAGSAFWLRQLPASDGWARQIFPLLLWIGAIALWAVWQKPKLLTFAGLLPIGHRALAITAATFIAIFGWHALRVAIGRPTSGLLSVLPVEIYVFMLGGILLNEVLFHGILQTRLTELFGPKFAIPLTAAVVLAFRMPSFFVAGSTGIEPVMLYSILLLSLLAGILRFVTGSLWPAIALQAGNALGTLL
ncbi:MAG TPA: CPBP family glutamic-type intramembrane protease [Kaistia sp.]|nr:CPBP family glutamic-type intramembrane protease [Kaistia sp.]